MLASSIIVNRATGGRPVPGRGAGRAQTHPHLPPAHWRGCHLPRPYALYPPAAPLRRQLRAPRAAIACCPCSRALAELQHPPPLAGCTLHARAMGTNNPTPTRVSFLGAPASGITREQLVKRCAGKEPGSAAPCAAGWCGRCASGCDGAAACAAAARACCSCADRDAACALQVPPACARGQRSAGGDPCSPEARLPAARDQAVRGGEGRAAGRVLEWGGMCRCGAQQHFHHQPTRHTCTHATQVALPRRRQNAPPGLGRSL